MYNQKVSWASKDIANSTKIQQPEVERILSSLNTPKQKMLLLENNNYSINNDFSAEKLRFSINLLKKESNKKVKEENKEDEFKSTSLERAHVIQVRSFDQTKLSIKS